MPKPLVTISRLVKRYVSPDATGTTVLNGIDLGVSRGESVAVMGPSGSGKSTLLQIIGTLDRQDSGEFYLGDEDIAALKADQLASLRNRRIGFVFQAHHLLPQCTTLENVLIPALAERSRVPDAVAERGRQLLIRVGLGHRIDYLASALSGGERQRAAVVRALINKPDLLLADEPTGALDQKSSIELCDLLVQLNREEDLALIVATHSREVAARMQRVLRLSGGVLVPAQL